MPRRGEGPPRIMRIVQGLKGRVPIRMELALRPDYASIVPWTEAVPDGALATAGPDAFHLTTSVPLEVKDGTIRSDFIVVEGARERLTLTWHLSYEETPPVEDADSALARTERGGGIGVGAAPTKARIATPSLRHSSSSRP
jgi:hypothetical protein